jgi:hypothetical protein
MITLRKSLLLVAALLCSTLTFSAMGAKPPVKNIDKAYSLTMSTPDLAYNALDDVVAPVKVVAKLTNLAPPSTAASNVGSFRLRLAVAGVTIFTDGTPEHAPQGSSGDITVVPPNNVEITVTNMGPLKGGDAYTLTFWVTSCGDSKWDADVFTGSSLSGDTFKRTESASNLFTIVRCGTVACGGGFEIADTTGESANPFLTGKHGAFNQDGSCSALSYFTSNMFVTSKQLHFRWPTSEGPKASFEYTIDSDTNTPKVGWLNKDGVLADKAADQTEVVAYINAPTCISDQLPAPYGALSQVASATATQIKVSTSPPSGAVLPVPPVPFSIIIGRERMRVDAIQGTTWTVTRNFNGANAEVVGNTDPVKHSAGAKVMSTPLPLLDADHVAATFVQNGVTVTFDPPVPSPYAINDQAQMCIVPGWPVAIDDPATPWSIKFFDIGDGWVRIGNF